MKKTVLFLKKNILWFAGILFVVLYLYSDIIFEHYKISFASHMYKVSPWSTDSISEKGPIFTDIEDSEYPALYSIYMNGNGFSFWNNKVALGAASSAAYIMYPLNYVYLLPVDFAVWLKTILEFTIAFIGIYLLLREYKCGKMSASIAGVCYAFSATIVMWLGWSHSDVAAWAPFAFWLAEQLITKIKIKYAIWMSIVIFLMYIAGMPTFAAYFTYLLGFYVLFRTVWNYRKDKKKIIWIFVLFGCSIVLGVFLTLPYTISLVQSVGENGYAATRGYQAFAALDREYMRTMIFPYFREGLKEHVNEGTLYCGILPVLLFPLSFIRIKKKKQGTFFCISSVVIALLIFTPVFDTVYSALPMINTSLKYRIITLLMFTLTVSAGLNLDDILKNPQCYKSRLYIIGGLFIWSVVILSISSAKLLKLADSDNDNLAYYNKALILFFAFLVFLFFYVMGRKRIFIVAIAGFVIWDMCGFAKEYLPLIDKDMALIPEATESIVYMQGNTDNYERIAGIGEWTYMANTNIYYGLSDVRAHDFVTTNQDIMTYYTAIYPFCYPSATRVAFNKISNYNLLKYLGVRYIVGENVTLTDIYNSIWDRYATTEELKSGEQVKQQVNINHDDFYACQILVGTCDTIFTQDDVIRAYLVEDTTKKVLADAEVCLSDISDNTFVRFVFGIVKTSPNKKYSILFEMPEDFEEHFVIYKSEMTEDNNQLTVDDDRIPGRLIMKIEYLDESLEEVFSGADNLVIAEMDEYSPKVQFAENIIVEDSYESVLKQMKKEYLEAALFITGGEYRESTSGGILEDDETVELLEYKDDYIKIKYTANHDRYIIINDYYNENWKAYINGEKTEIVKGNYLLRAVDAYAGSDMVLELKYEPQTTYVMFVISMLDFVVIIVLAVFCRKIQKFADKKAG